MRPVSAVDDPEGHDLLIGHGLEDLLVLVYGSDYSGFDGAAVLPVISPEHFSFSLSVLKRSAARLRSIVRINQFSYAKKSLV